MRKIHLLYFALIISITNGSAQNLVPNPSFEEYDLCPNTIGEVIQCHGWWPALHTPDYFSECSPYPASVPNNALGSQPAYSGNSYIGLYTYEYWEFWRETVGTQLIQPMIPGSSYNVSMRVSRGNWTNMAYNCAASNKIGMRFTTTPYSYPDTVIINNYAQVYSDSIITDTLGWTVLQWEYLADSAYNYLYIGNFFDDEHTDTSVINPPLGHFGSAYYFIDSVEISCKTNCAANLSDLPKEFSFAYLSNRILTLSFPNDNQFYLKIYDISGRLCAFYPSTNQRNISLEDFNPGTYLLFIYTDTKTYYKKIVLT